MYSNSPPLKLPRRVRATAMLVLLILGFAPPLRAAAPTPLDLLVLVDDSGSMKKTDPLTLRVPASELVFSLLGQGDRAGLVVFAGHARDAAVLAPVDAAGRARLFKALRTVRSRGRHTNLDAPLAAALRMLGDAPSPGRKRAVILLSDGHMDTGSVQRDHTLADDVRTRLLPALHEAGIAVYTVAFSDDADRALLGAMAKATGGTESFVRRNRELHHVFSAIIERLKAPQMLPVENGSFLVDPSVKEITLVIDKPNADIAVGLVPPDGAVLAHDKHGRNVRWMRSPAFDMVTVANPSTGHWRVIAPAGQRVRAYALTNLRLDAVLAPHDVRPGQPVQLVARLNSGQGVVESAEVLDSTHLKATLTRDGTALESLALARDAHAGDGVFKATFVAPVAGSYRLSIEARGATFARARELQVEARAPAPAAATPPVSPSPSQAVPHPAPSKTPAAGPSVAVAHKPSAAPAPAAVPAPGPHPAAPPVAPPAHTPAPSGAASTVHGALSTSRFMLLFVAANALLVLLAAGVYLGRRLLARRPHLATSEGAGA